MYKLTSEIKFPYPSRPSFLQDFFLMLYVFTASLCSQWEPYLEEEERKKEKLVLLATSQSLF